MAVLLVWFVRISAAGFLGTLLYGLMFGAFYASLTGFLGGALILLCLGILQIPVYVVLGRTGLLPRNKSNRD